MGKGREMRRLADEILRGVTLPVPAAPDTLFAALVEVVRQRRGRPVVLCTEVFPPHTASGLWLELETCDVIVVEKRAAPWHQLVIFFHEVWHMLEGDCGGHRPGAPGVAARTGFSTHAEREAERFGLLMGRKLRGWLRTGTGPVAAQDPDGVATRIEAALGYRGPRG